MSENYTCVIIDDEPKMTELLHDMLGELYPSLTVDAIFNSWKPALTHLRNAPPDILFTDISMPEKSGFDLLELLPDLNSQIIFVTAHTEYAMDAFNFDVCGYILKPINDKNLLMTVDRAIKRIKNRTSILQAKQDTQIHKIGIPDSTGVNYIALNDILYCESNKRYTRVVTNTSEILSSYNLGKFDEYLPGSTFYQVHRSYIVNINHVQKYDSSGNIVMSNNKEIPVARSGKDEFLAMFNKIGKKD